MSAAAEAASLERLTYTPTGHPARLWARETGRPVADTGRIPPALLDAWKREGSPLPKPRRRPSAEGVDPGRATAAYATLRAALVSALDDGLIPANPCRIRGASSHTANERGTCTPAEVGARGTGKTKTRGSVRTVYLPRFVVDELRHHLDSYTGARADALVFTTETGNPVTSRTLSRLFARARAAIGRPELHWHDLRHTGATLAYREGASVKDVQRRLGNGVLPVQAVSALSLLAAGTLRSAAGTPESAPARPEGVQLRARRSPRLIAVGVLLVVLGGLASAALYSATTDHREVVTMARDVARGAVLRADDLVAAEVPGGFAPEALPAELLAGLVGQQALLDLPRGSFPLAHHIGEDPLPAGQSLVGLKLALGRIPSTPLPSGTRVAVVGVGEGLEQTVEAFVATAPVALPDGLTYAVDLRVASADAPALARLAAADSAALVVIGEP